MSDDRSAEEIARANTEVHDAPQPDDAEDMDEADIGLVGSTGAAGAGMFQQGGRESRRPDDATES